MKLDTAIARPNLIVRLIALALFASFAAAQGYKPEFYVRGTTPKPKAEDYAAHGKSGDVEIGAEFMVRSFARGDAMFIAPGYITVEIALYAPKDKPVDIDYADFQLTVNNKKIALLPQAPQMVASSLEHPEWRELYPGGSVSGGMDGRDVTLGGPPRPQLPTNNPPGSAPTPIPQVPRPGLPDEIDRQPRPTAEQTAIEAALPNGKQKAPISGFLYFVYTGSNKSIKSVELRYREAVLKLR